MNLLPCPFCGGSASKSTGKTADGKDWHYIECGSCQACAEIDFWNRRCHEANYSLPWTPEETAKRFHEAMQSFCPKFGRRPTEVPWGDVLPMDRDLIIAVVRNVFIEQASHKYVPQPSQEKP